MASNDKYRSIADVVGNLHGGKYQFNNYGAVGAYDSEYSGCGSGEQYKEEEEEEMPKWAMRMEPSQSDIEQAKLIVVPSNLDPMDGMVYYSLIKIQNEERTWEKFFVKIMAKGQDGKFIQQENGLFIAKPTSGSLAPRGGASNACDERNPYSDSAEIKIMHNSSGSILIPSIGDFFLVAATEEEMWCYKVRLESSGQRRDKV